MKYLLPLFFFFNSIAYAQNTPAPAAPSTFKKDSVIRDLTVLYNLINVFHPGQFMFCTPKEFDDCYDSLRQTITTDLNIADYYMKLACLTAKVHDGHTRVDHSSLKESMKEQLVFPFSIYRINDQYVLDRCADPALAELKGSTLLKINNQPIEQVVSKMHLLIGLEGKNESGLNYSLQSFPFYYYLEDAASSFTIEYTDAGGTAKTKELTGIAHQSFEKNTRRIVNIMEQDFKNNTAILTVNTFMLSDYEYMNLDYEKYIDAFFKKVRKSKVKNLVIDVRGNSGGAPEISNYLYSYLSNKYYYYFEYVGKKYSKARNWKNYCTDPQSINDPDTLKTQKINGLYCETKKTDKKRWWYKQQKGKSSCFRGNIITLTDGGCYSTTGHFVALIKNNHIGKLYGECSQGSYYSNDGGRMFCLPYSKMLVRMPTAQFRMLMPDFPYDPKGICPDTEIKKTADDIKNGTDRVLLTVLEETEKMK